MALCCQLPPCGAGQHRPGAPSGLAACWDRKGLRFYAEESGLKANKGGKSVVPQKSMPLSQGKGKPSPPSPSPYRLQTRPVLNGGTGAAWVSFHSQTAQSLTLGHSGTWAIKLTSHDSTLGRKHQPAALAVARKVDGGHGGQLAGHGPPLQAQGADMGHQMPPAPSFLSSVLHWPPSVSPRL